MPEYSSFAVDSKSHLGMVSYNPVTATDTMGVRALIESTMQTDSRDSSQNET